MNDKARRQGAILRLVRERRISTQEELVGALGAAGYEVVQTTVSRDIHELGLTKVRMSDGTLVYAPADALDSDRLRGLGPALQRWALTVEASGNLVVVTTLAAMPRRSPTPWTTPATRASSGRSPARTPSWWLRARASPAPSSATSCRST